MGEEQGCNDAETRINELIQSHQERQAAKDKGDYSGARSGANRGGFGGGDGGRGRGDRKAGFDRSGNSFGAAGAQ